MATISVNTNIGEVTERLRTKLNKLKDKDYLLRPVCFDLIELMKRRIHKDGISADGGPIGTYSTAYLRYRQKYHGRDNSTKVIVSLTRQLENNWAVIATPRGYGIGFLNPFALQKARWVEEIKGVDIFNLSLDENKYASDMITQLTRDALTND